MTTKAKPIPDGYHSITPYLILKRAGAAIEFYKNVFAAIELVRMPGPDGKVMHAELKIGDSVVMLADEFPEMGALSPETIGGSPSFLLLYVEDVDAVTARATAAGAKLLRPVQNRRRKCNGAWPPCNRKRARIKSSIPAVIFISRSSLT
jgi:PhnB protein